MKQNELQSIIYDFYEFEFELQEHDFEDFVQNFQKEYESDCISIACSYIGNTTEFESTTTFIPSKLKLHRDIYSFEYEGSFQESIFFSSINEFRQYIYNSTFDSLLNLEDIEEELLIKLCKSEKEV